VANGVYAGPEEPLSPDVLSLYTMKNWLPFVFGPPLAIATVPAGYLAPVRF